MNIRGKSSPVQSNIRTVTTGSAPRGQTPPPPQQLRGQFEDPTHFHPPYQAAAPPLQPQQAYLDMNKPAAGRVGQGLPQTAQAYNVPRPHQQQAYNQLVADAQEQPAAPMAWNAPQQNYYIPNPTQGVRPQRMPAMNNGQVPGGNFALMPGMPASMPFMANQMQGYNGSNLQNPNQQFMVGNQFMQYQQPRMPFQTMQQQAPMYNMGYGAPAPGGAFSFYQAPMQMANTNRPASAGPQGAGGHVQKQGRSKNILKLADPNTGEDLTDKVFKAQATEDTDSNAQESQAHRNAVTLEFATKVAILANNKESDTSHDAQPAAQAPSAEAAAGLSTPATEAVTAATTSTTQPPAQSVPQDSHAMLNGEPDQQNIPPAHSVEPPAPATEPARAPAPAPAPASFSVPASAEREEAKQPVETVAAAPDVQTPSPAQAATPVVPVADTAPSANVPAKEMSPAPVIEKPSASPAAAVPEKEPTPQPDTTPKAEPASAAPMQTTTVSAADAASLIVESTSGQEADSKPAPQASGPQPQRQDGRKNKKNKKDLNKKSKEGSDMDAFYDPQTSQDGSDVTSPEPPAEEAPSTAPVTEAAVSPPPEAPAAAGADAPMEPAKEPSPAPAPAPAPALAPSPPKETAPARVETSPVPEVVVEPPEDKEAEPDENGVAADPESADKPRPKQINGVQLHYKEGQWSPSNPEGKKQYDRDFLLKLQANPESRKPPSLPNMPEILVDPQVFKMEDFQRQFSGRSCPVDFTPGFFKSTPRTGGPGSMNKRGSQQGRRGGQGSQGGEQRIIPSLRQEIKLHKAEDAYKPFFQKETADKPDDDKETEKLLRAFQSILNKLTPQKYSKLSKEALELKIDTEERVIGVCNLIFEKAISESKFAMWYANLCKDMMKLKVPKTSNPNEFITFRAILLTKCQKEFESDTIVEGDLDRRRKELESADEDKKTQLLEELEEATVKARRRSMGNIRFIGELYRLKMLTENIMHDCIFKLLKIRDDDSIECLCKLLETIGKDLDHPKAKQRMDQYFAQFEKMTADMSTKEQGAWSKDSTPSKPKDSSKDKLCTRVKFSVLEIIDMRKNGWEQRQIHAQNKPTTIEEIHQKAKQEQQEAQFLNSQPRPDPNLAARGAKGKGRGSMQGDSDGWNTVPAKPVRQQIDATKMKITKTNVDEITLTLGGGNKFSNWGRGSQGGGSRSQEQEKSGNRYNALNNLNDNDGRRGYGRSPARGDSRGGGRMGGDRDRDRRDRDRDFRKPPNRSSMEAERERALTSTRNILGAGGTSNPSSRNASRDNSRSRDVAAAPAAKERSGPDAKAMSADELDRRLNTIAEELHSNGSIKDAKDSLSEIQNLDYSQVVTTMLEKLVEKPGNTRKLLGQLLFDMVREKQLTIEALIKGIAEFLSFAEDLELDIPKIYDNLAEVFAPLVQDNKVLPLNFLQACVQPLVDQGNKKEAVLVQKILARAADYKSKDVVQAQWAASGLKFSDFGINEKSSNFELQWLKSPVRNTVYTGVCSLLQRPDCTNEEVFQWIDKNFSAEERETNQFVRELTSAICRSYINTATKKLDTEGLKQRVPLLRKYLDDDKERGTQALFAVQHLLCELEHPQGVVRSLFDLFYDEDIISEDSFFEWENRDGPPDDMVGKGVVKMNVKDFFDWLRSSGEEDKTS